MQLNSVECGLEQSYNGERQRMERMSEDGDDGAVLKDPGGGRQWVLLNYLAVSDWTIDVP